ncbi:site-specific integrase [Halomonas sp. V046]|uniref:site-specific integrase n=1 Tax=Halomonas sp. V046 TaxID=3459611 RepID=UPI004043BA96
MKIKQRVKVSSYRSVFTTEDIEKVFEAVKPFRNSSRPHRYWLPYLGLYGALRLNEACQLYKEDIKTVNGIPCIHVQAIHPDQNVKSLSSERLIPIHHTLVDLGFMEYVEALGDGGRVFSELTWHKHHGYSAQPSKWFGRLRESIGIKKEDERKDYHSYRHTVADYLKQKGFSENLIGGLLGHTAGGITNNRYGKQYKTESIFGVVEAIDIQ